MMKRREKLPFIAQTAENGASDELRQNVRDGSARDEALTRRNVAVRKTLRIGPKPGLAPESEQPIEQKSDDKPTD